VVKFHAHLLLLGSRPEDHHGNHMIFDPSTDPEESKIMPLFHSQPHSTKEPEHPFGVIGLEQLPPQIEQIIGLVAGDQRRLT